jgi:hypothetical protein
MNYAKEDKSGGRDMKDSAIHGGSAYWRRNPIATVVVAQTTAIYSSDF